MIPYIFNPTVKAVTDASGAILGQATSRALPHATYCEVTEELNGEFSLAMGYPAKEFDAILTEGHANGIVDLIIAANVKNGQNGYWEPFRIFQVNKQQGMYDILAKHISYDLSWYTVSNPNSAPRTQYGSLGTLVNYITSQSSWSSTGFSMSYDSDTSFDTGVWWMLFPQSLRSLIQDVFISKEYAGKELDVSGWNVYLTSRRGSTNSTLLIDGVNADVTSVKTNAENAVDAVDPWLSFKGANDEDMFSRLDRITYPSSTLQVTHAVARDIRQDFHDGNDYPTQQEVQQRATKWIYGNYTPPEASIEMKAYADITTRNVGDTFTIIAPRMGMARYTGRLLKVTYDVLNERPESVYFDAVRAGVGDIIWTR